ncbi:hypothetical protein HDU67_002732 [Dinochytrium kinnereticum]|nr:hypothetical protein HDU67_002732 [Dinochytrium kinnereticum]
MKFGSAALFALLAASSAVVKASPIIIAAQQSISKPACPAAGNGDGSGSPGSLCKNSKDCVSGSRCINSQCSIINSSNVPHCRLNADDKPIFVEVLDDESLAAPPPQFIQEGNPSFQVIEPSFKEVTTTTTTTSTIEAPSSTDSPESTEEASAPPAETPAPEAPAPAPETPAPAPVAPAPVPVPEERSPTKSPPGALRPEQISKCETELHIRMTSVYETSKTELDFGMCGNINDGRGYSFGCVQFTTATSGLSVYRYYKRLVKEAYARKELDSDWTPMDRFEGPLSRSNGKVSWSGEGEVWELGGFCDVVRNLANDPFFQEAQLHVSKTYYMDPAYELAYRHGVTSQLFRGQIYDTAIQLGPGTAQSILENMSVDPNNEAESLRQFMWAKQQRLPGFGPAFPGTQYRIDSYRRALDRGYLRFDDEVRFLDNSGREIGIKCNS